MSSSNVELVRSSFEAFRCGDFDQAFAVYDPAVEWHTADDEPDSRGAGAKVTAAASRSTCRRPTRCSCATG